MSKIVRSLTVAVALFTVAFVAVLPTVTAATGQTRALPPKSRLVSLQPVPRLPYGSKALGALAPHATLSGAVALKPANDAALRSFIGTVTNKNSPLYHHYLAAGAFKSRFGPSPAAISAVKATIEAAGLKVTGVASDGMLVEFKGSVKHAESVFHTNIESYRMQGGWIGHATTETVKLRLPTAVSTAVAGVIGLDDLVQSRPADIRPSPKARSQFPKATAADVPSVSGAPSACSDAQQAAVESGGLTDDQIANAYGAFGLYKDGDFGQGEHIAVFELQPFLASDIETFDTCYFGATEAAEMSGTNGDLAGSRLSIVPVDGGEPQPSAVSENDEADLDIEDVSAMAPEADIDVYEAPNTTFGSLDEYAAIVNSDKDQIVTSSWAECEQLTQEAEPGIQQAENFLFQQAAAQGQTVFSSAGDTGDDSCNEYRYVVPPSGQNLLSELDPGSQPYVVSVGGTTIDDATQPPSEHVWNDGADWGSGGGGISETWAMPTWQENVALTPANKADVANAEALETATASESAPNTTPTFCDGTLGLTPGTPCREVPDVSAQADEFTGSVTIYGQSLGYGFADGWATIGGTSSSSPIWASMLALVNASSSCSADLVNGVQDVGFASPILYGIAASPTAYAASFNDITTGNNDDYGLDNGLVFPARAGYDMASGLGSPQLTSPSGGIGLAFYMCGYAAQLRPPTVTALSPISGPVTGSEVITVTGTGFGSSTSPAVASVEVGNSHATSFSVVSGTSMRVTLPAAIATVAAGSPNPTEDGAGPAQIVVTLTNGESSDPSASSLFEYVDVSSAKNVPSVTSLSPYGGLDTSPATVTIFGSGFATCPPGSPGASCPGSLVSEVESVDFGGVAATNVVVVSPFEVTVTPPPFSDLDTAAACPVDNGASGQPLNPAQDVCQVEVTVTTSEGTSATATILPPYEGPLEYDNQGGEILPAGCGCEDEPQTSEFDYVPAPTVTSVSTGTVADLPANAADLASEYGGSTSNLVELTGTGMDPLTFEYLLLGTPINEDSIDYPLQLSGTSLLLFAPPLPAVEDGGNPTVEPATLPAGLASLAGQSNQASIVYAGVPEINVVTNTSNSRTLDGVYGAPATGGAPLDINGSGMLQVVGPIAFEDDITGFSLGTQYNFTATSDTDILTESVGENPALVDTEVCSETACNIPSTLNYPPTTADELIIYPPGAPDVTSVSPSSGPDVVGPRWR